MASITKIGTGYRAQIKLTLAKGEPPVRDSKVFEHRRDARQWAADRERELREQHEADPRLAHTLMKALRRYADEVSPTKRGEQWERVRLAAFELHKLPMTKPLLYVTAQDIAEFRDDRLKTVKAGTVLREIGLLSAVFTHAKKEWEWTDRNPCADINKPSKPRHRKRTIKWWEVKRMLRQMDYRVGASPRSLTQALALCFMVALRTGMRAGEMTNMKWEQVFERHCYLPLTKTGDEREVPLSRQAIRLFMCLRGWDLELVFGLQAQTRDTLFRKYRARAKLDGFTFHDARHTAATIIARRMDVLSLCKMFGWSDPKQAMVYYNPDISELADCLL